MSRPTIADLAKAANVGVSTVDRVLNGRDPVRAQTAEQVLQAAERIGFHGSTAIRRRIENEKPTRKFGFLLQQSHRKLYQMWGQSLAKATEAYRDAHGRSIVRFVDDLTPDNVAANLEKLGREVDAVAIVASDQPKINHAIDALEAEGVPVFTLISDMTAPGRAGYVGTDNLKKGRTAAWFIANMCREPGPVAVFVGTHRYLSQDMCEMGFRSYFRESGADFPMLETMATQEEANVGYELTLNLLKTTPNLAGLYVAGGGITGVMRALREHGGPAAGRIIVVAHELTNETRAGLADGVIKAVLSHPTKLMADTLVQAMAEAVSSHRSPSVVQHILPFEIFTAANI
ncbi:LacI family DNA-binding transcriptional regulator [Rhizobium sp. ICMP 5592]|uniref:LacI family DNA-binding transcriptional regulator n=1 Tax=Rhizobium sp. ICMP 5592 TaxID=2292445 RepID=UPI001296933B|nr:LacI family DNA-binding transcriptional regulator [Rhizobium sp. ICMP 5592]MQB46135.1 LacI family DNA-binding transcriptional regulator [Rhizobium sp. ICMP 5592]